MPEIENLKEKFISEWGKEFPPHADKFAPSIAEWWTKEIEKLNGRQTKQIKTHTIMIERILEGVCEGCGGDNPMCHMCLGKEWKKKHNKE